MSLLEKMNEANQLPNSWITEWKKTKKVVGYLCSYIPEEILYAAKVLPIRVTARGHSDSTLADACMSRLNCPFARYLLDMVLAGKLDFLDGIIAYNSCDHVRRMFDNWRLRHAPPFYHFLSIPHRTDALAMNWFRGELISFKKHLESHFKVTISDKDLLNAIKIHNKTRNLLTALYDLRKEEAPKVKGSEIAAIMTACMSMPKDQFNPLLTQLLDELKARDGFSGLPRIMVVGSLVDNPEYIKVIEDLGSIVIADSQCFGSKYFMYNVREDQNPLDALTERYLLKSPCPRMLDDATGHEVRLKLIKDSIKANFVDGVVFERMAMCDLWSGEIYMLQKELKDLGVPTLTLERDYILSGVGQMKTRCQAFIEVLR